MLDATEGAILFDFGEGFRGGVSHVKGCARDRLLLSILGVRVWLNLGKGKEAWMGWGYEERKQKLIAFIIEEGAAFVWKARSRLCGVEEEMCFA